MPATCVADVPEAHVAACGELYAPKPAIVVAGCLGSAVGAREPAIATAARLLAEITDLEAAHISSALVAQHVEIRRTGGVARCIAALCQRCAQRRDCRETRKPAAPCTALSPTTRRGSTSALMNSSAHRPAPRACSTNRRPVARPVARPSRPGPSHWPHAGPRSL